MLQHFYPYLWMNFNFKLNLKNSYTLKQWNRTKQVKDLKINIRMILYFGGFILKIVSQTFPQTCHSIN